jgi:hypothetical protein
MLAAAFLRSLPDHALVDRLVRGRAWIPLLGAMLAGIVAMQVEVLKLGASIGRSIERGSALQTRNEQLRASVAALADDQRIERLAARMGMIMPLPDAITFLSAHPDAAAPQAIANIHAPDPTQFLSSQSPTGAVAVPAASSQATTTTSGTGSSTSAAASTPVTGIASAPATSTASNLSSGSGSTSGSTDVNSASNATSAATGGAGPVAGSASGASTQSTASTTGSSGTQSSATGAAAIQGATSQAGNANGG